MIWKPALCWHNRNQSSRRRARPGIQWNHKINYEFMRSNRRVADLRDTKLWLRARGFRRAQWSMFSFVPFDCAHFNYNYYDCRSCDNFNHVQTSKCACTREMFPFSPTHSLARPLFIVSILQRSLASHRAYAKWMRILYSSEADRNGITKKITTEKAKERRRRKKKTISLNEVDRNYFASFFSFHCACVCV